MDYFEEKVNRLSDCIMPYDEPGFLDTNSSIAILKQIYIDGTHRKLEMEKIHQAIEAAKIVEEK